MEKEKLTKILSNLIKNRHKADLHSFMSITQANKIVFVRANLDKTITILFDCELIGTYNINGATDKLIGLNIMLDTIEM